MVLRVCAPTNRCACFFAAQLARVVIVVVAAAAAVVVVAVVRPQATQGADVYDDDEAQMIEDTLEVEEELMTHVTDALG
jgi:hypothetical protein